MEHKSNILLIGFHNSLKLDSMPHISLKNCNTGQEAIELIIKEDFDLVISKCQLDDQNAIELNQSTESIKNYCTNSTPKKFNLLIITTTFEEEQICIDNKLLFYPKTINIKSLILKLTLPTDPKRTGKKAVLINFKDLFIRVDNNREFIQTVIEKFFEIRDSRIKDIKDPLKKENYKLAKDAAHKLKGVLANFSMEVARTTIIELEKLILDNEQELSLEKLDQLIVDIENARKFYLDNLNQFKS